MAVPPPFPFTTRVEFNNEKTGLDFISYDTVTHGPLVALVFQL